jgi:small subunit ribosomal protein S24e
LIQTSRRREGRRYEVMEIEVLHRKDNKLLDRTEISFRIYHPDEQTPEREKVREQIAALARTGKETVIIDHLRAEFGKQETTGYAKVYKTKEKALEVEREHILMRNKLIEAEKKKKVVEKKAEEGGG